MQFRHFLEHKLSSAVKGQPIDVKKQHRTCRGGETTPFSVLSSSDSLTFYPLRHILSVKCSVRHAMSPETTPRTDTAHEFTRSSQDRKLPDGARPHVQAGCGACDVSGVLRAVGEIVPAAGIPGRKKHACTDRKSVV